MKKMLLLLLLPLLLAAGCSLTDADAQAPGSAQLRLLTGTGEPTTLSHPDYDDWSPQMVNFQGTNYLYFLSTRPYEGPYYDSETSFWGGFTSISNLAPKVLRATEVRPGEFSNLQLFYVTSGGNYPAMAVVSNESYPKVFLQKNEEGTNNIYVVVEDGSLFENLYEFDKYLGGVWATDSESHVMVGQNSIEQRTFYLPPIGLGQPISISVSFSGLVFQADNNSGEYEGNAVLSIKPDLSLVQPDHRDRFLQYFRDELDRFRYNQDLAYRGSGPALFTTDGTDTRFGFYVSLGGRLLQLVYLNLYTYTYWASDSSSLESIVADPVRLGDQRLIPLFSLTHYAGTIDKDPSYDQQSGNLFFASDREGRGKFNLYYVPKEYLKLPAGIIPAEVQQPLP